MCSPIPHPLQSFNSSIIPEFKLWSIFFANNLTRLLGLLDVNGRPRRFHGSKTEWGFDQFIPLSIFNDPSAGYLIDDTCVFGAEIFLIKSTGKGERLSLIKNATVCRHTLKIQRFSRLAEETYFSKVFIAEDYQWYICSRLLLHFLFFYFIFGYDHLTPLQAYRTCWKITSILIHPTVNCFI